MILKMNNREFQEFRKFILEMKNQKLNKSFNEIFSSEPTGGVKGFVNPITKDIEVYIPESLSFEVEKVFVKHAPDISKMVKGGSSITNAPKWLSCIKNIFNDIKLAITNTKIGKRNKDHLISFLS